MESFPSKTPSQVSTIKPEVTVNQDSSPPTITVEVNGTSSTANLPSSVRGKTFYNQPLSTLIEFSNDLTFEIKQDFDIEYVYTRSGTLISARTTVYKGTYNLLNMIGTNYHFVIGGTIICFNTNILSCYIYITNENNITVYLNRTPITSETATAMTQNTSGIKDLDISGNMYYLIYV